MKLDSVHPMEFPDFAHSASLAPCDEHTDVEHIEHALGKLVVLIAGDRRRYHDLLSATVDESYGRAIQSHANSYRDWSDVGYATGNIALESLDLVVSLAPQVIPHTESLFNARPISNHFSDAQGNVDLAALGAGASKMFSGVNKTLQAAKQVHDNRNAATRIELASLTERLKARSEQRRQEALRHYSEEQEAIRQHETRKSRQADVKQALAR